MTNTQKVDVRRFCGYPAYGADNNGSLGWRFYTAYGALEYRMNNLGPEEEAVVSSMLQTLSGLEATVPAAADNLDTESAASWTHNANEVGDRLRLLDAWRRRLCQFFGVPPGEGLGSSGISWVV